MCSTIWMNGNSLCRDSKQKRLHFFNRVEVLKKRVSFWIHRTEKEKEILSSFISPACGHILENSWESINCWENELVIMCWSLGIRCRITSRKELLITGSGDHSYRTWTVIKLFKEAIFELHSKIASQSLFFRFLSLTNYCLKHLTAFLHFVRKRINNSCI